MWSPAFIYLFVDLLALAWLQKCRRISRKFSVKVRLGRTQRWLDFGGDPDQHLDPGCDWRILYHCRIRQTSACCHLANTAGKTEAARRRIATGETSCGVKIPLLATPLGKYIASAYALSLMFIFELVNIRRLNFFVRDWSSPHFLVKHGRDGSW